MGESAAGNAAGDRSDSGKPDAAAEGRSSSNKAKLRDGADE